MDHRKLTQAELVSEARERFGDDVANWAFVCPGCLDVATMGDFKAALAKHPRKHHDGSDTIASDIAGQECIGRTLGALKKSDADWTGRGCDWAAYGLFRGPWEIVMPGGHSAWSFPLAEAPAAT